MGCQSKRDDLSGVRHFLVPAQMNNWLRISSLIIPATLMALPLSADQKTGTLDLYWIDAEGGGSTLIVTPAGQSVLIDTGTPATAPRILRTAKENGLEKLDYVIVTHFHTDHFGGVAGVAAEMSIGQLWDNGLPETDPDHNPDNAFWRRVSEPYRQLKLPHHDVRAGDVISLSQRPAGPALAMRCFAASHHFVDAPASKAENPLTTKLETRAADTSDNVNSSVWVVDFGPFRFFDGGDLTWNAEGELVAPLNRVGQVDVYQVNHHGLPISNNPVLIHSLAPTVAVMNNGATKGTAQSTLEALRTSPGIKAIYQNHKNLRKDEAANNTEDEFIANTSADAKTCPGNLIKMTVAPDGTSYTIEIPATGHKRTYQTRLDKPAL